MKKALWVTLGLGFLVLGWYIFIRQYEYEVNFKAKTLPGDIIETIRIWDRSTKDSEIISTDSVFALNQRIVWNGRTYNYIWHFSEFNDSTTKVNIRISEPMNRIKNKLLIPITEQPIESDAKDISNLVYGIIKSHLDITHVELKGLTELAPKFCACITKETSQPGKANGMMVDYGFITSFIADNNLKLDGPPQVRVINWSHSQGKLTYDFCFPIIHQDSLPTTKEITFKAFDKMNVLKAVYNGNYITSDRAWYYLVNEAVEKNYEIIGGPIEYFYNNPNLGINEETWKAEIFLPINFNP